MSERAVLYFELLEWLEVGINLSRQDSYLLSCSLADNFKSRGACQHDGDANHGRSWS